jgi:hypothetical protein
MALLGVVDATAATVTVTVSNDVVVVDPAGLKLPPSDPLIVFKLATPGYVFPTSNAVVITGTGATFKCSNTPGGLEVNCRRSGKGNGSQQGYVVKVVPAPGAKAAPPKSSPNIWIQSD